MNGARVCTVMFGSMPFTAVWEVALHAAVDGKPPVELVAAGAAPQVIAAVLVVAAFLDPAARADRQPAPDRPVPAPRRQVAARTARKELAR